jgi:hypothetical protein
LFERLKRLRRDRYYVQSKNIGSGYQRDEKKWDSWWEHKACNRANPDQKKKANAQRKRQRPAPIRSELVFVSYNILDEQVPATKRAERKHDPHERNDADECSVVARSKGVRDFNEIEGLYDQAQALANGHPYRVARELALIELLKHFV